MEVSTITLILSVVIALIFGGAMGTMVGFIVASLTRLFYQQSYMEWVDTQTIQARMQMDSELEMTKTEAHKIVAQASAQAQNILKEAAHMLVHAKGLDPKVVLPPSGELN